MKINIDREEAAAMMALAMVADSIRVCDYCRNKDRCKMLNRQVCFDFFKRIAKKYIEQERSTND